MSSFDKWICASQIYQYAIVGLICFITTGYDLPEYDVVEEGRGRYKCRVEWVLFQTVALCNMSVEVLLTSWVDF